MSRILDELKDAVLSCSMEEKLPHRWVDNHEMVGGAIDMIDSLGENARRMLEIGIVQDEIVKLFSENYYLKIDEEDCNRMDIIWLGFFDTKISIYIQFQKHQAHIQITKKTKYNPRNDNYGSLERYSLDYSYDSPTWQDDLINKVKGLKECNS